MAAANPQGGQDKQNRFVAFGGAVGPRPPAPPATPRPAAPPPSGSGVKLYSCGPCYIYVSQQVKPANADTELHTEIDPPIGEDGALEGAQTIQNNVDPGSNFAYFGTAERAPVIQIMPRYVPVFSDNGGRTTPDDLLFDGEEAYVFADINRYDENVYKHLARRPNLQGHTYGPGYCTIDDLGTLLVHEGANIVLYLVFPYAYKFDGMVPGYRFFHTTLAGPDTISPAGTKAKKIRCVWRAMRQVTPRGQYLYDNNISAVKDIPIDNALPLLG